MNRIGITSFILLLTISTNAFGTGTNSVSKRTPEPWYHFFELGTKFKIWHGSDSLGLNASFSVAPITYYKTINKKILLGLGANFEIMDSSNDELFYLGLSGSIGTQLYFKQIGDGIFIKADVGIAWHLIIEKELDPYYDTSFEYRIGGGYAFPLNKGTSLLTTLYYRSFFSFDRETTIHELALSVGLLM